MLDIVVVLNYFGADDTLACVQSLVASPLSAEIIVVDNGSFDDALDRVSQRWPNIVTIQNPQNLGFAGGMNVGIRRALALGAATVTVLNNDTIVTPGAVARLCDLAREGLVVSPTITYLADPERVWFGGGVIDPRTNLPRHLSAEELDARDSRDTDSEVVSSDVLAGCCVTATAQAWREVGLFNEGYFLNFEDSEWSLRARAHGLPLVVDRRTTITHRVSASFVGSYTHLGLYYYARNGLRFGRTSCSGSVRQSLAFLRHHVAPATVAQVRKGDRVGAWRSLVTTGYALRDYALGRDGRAPRRLEALAERWTRSGVTPPVHHA